MTKINLVSPLSTNQYQYLQRVCNSWLNIAEGGKRGGKNIVNVLAFAMTLEEHPNRLHLIGAVSIANAKMNIIDCDGYGLTNYFEGRCREGKYKNKEALFIKTRTGEKIVIVSGGAKDGDEKYIKGNTYGTAYITEVNECHIKFIREVFDRTLTSKDRKIFHDLNPKPESHYYYTDILNFHENKQAKDPEYGYNYGHFTIKDNMSITQEELNREMNKYDHKSVWFERDILGKRKQTEGLVYPNFNKKLHVAPSINRQYTRFYISNDYGTQHACVFLLWGLGTDGIWYCIKEYYHKGSDGKQKTVDEYYADLLEFAKGYKIECFIRDQAPIASSFNIHLRRKGDFASRDCDNEVLAGIQDVAMALNTGKIKINDRCVKTISEFGLYSWKKDSVNDEPIKENDDCQAALRYFVRTLRIVQPQWQSLI